MERTERIARGMRHDGYTALVCRLPQDVLMLTGGYQPMLGNAFCLVTLDGGGTPAVRLAIPEDDADLVPAGTAVAVKTFAEETMRWIGTTLEAVRAPLGALLAAAGVGAGAHVGYEGGHAPVATAYTQVGVPGPATLDLLRDLLPGARFTDATALLDELAATKTEAELEAIRRCARVAVEGFAAARASVRPGATEAEVAAAAHGGLLRAGLAAPGARHVLPFVHVMTGARAAQAYKAYNLTTNQAIQRGDTVMVQLEISINGYWAELTRTFFAGEASQEWQRAYTACYAAQEAALAIIRDGISGREADAAARAVMRAEGFGDAFKHGLGHGFGFQAINHGAAPILHPASEHILRTGMVHNMEPAVYLEGKGGFRLNDDVLVLARGGERLSADLPRDLEWLIAS
ncbi:MAG: aminopeptidase P family protein [Ktedonobacterales bacterium]|nr:aminopeptidase P family protein [Ktedonobacterales bacterium]